MLGNIEKLNSIILTFYLPSVFKAHRADVSKYFKDIKKLADTRGIEFAVSYNKKVRLAYTRFLSGHALSELESVSLDKDGFPCFISQFKRTIDVDNVDFHRLVMTCLISLRGLKFKPRLETESITMPWTGVDSITEHELQFAAYSLGIRMNSKELWTGFHASTKSGPQGQALTTSLTELTLLPQNLIDKLISLGGLRLGGRIERLKMKLWGDHSLASIWATMVPAKSKSFRKLSYFSDKEGKTRVIAILDYWSQTVLKPYHEYVNSILRGINCDRTFSQDKILTTLPPSGPYYSLDLSNATDRMPIALQKRVFSLMFGKELSDVWASVLCEWEYHSDAGSVKYNAGQPMGAYSSWPLMALTHHVIVRVAAIRAGIFIPFSDYVLLGDDLVIANSAVALQYKKLCGELQMPISDSKTHESERIFEFAKRWFIGTTEFTGFSAPGLKSVWKSYALLHNFLSTQENHGWSLPIDRHPGLIHDIYVHFGKLSQWERVVKLYMLFDSVTKVINRGTSEDFQLLARRSKEIFAIDVPSESTHFVDRPEVLAFMAFISAKKRLIKRDFEKHNDDSRRLLNKIAKSFKAKFPDLSVQDFILALEGYFDVHHEFKEYYSSVKLSSIVSPLLEVVSQQEKRLIKKARLSFGAALNIKEATLGVPAEGQVLRPLEIVIEDREYFKEGISKYFITSKIFTMRNAFSISLAEAQVVKAIIDDYKAQVLTPELVAEYSLRYDSYTLK